MKELLSLQEVAPCVFLLRVGINDYELGLMFMRYQEFYESCLDDIREKPTTLAMLMSSYTQRMSSSKQMMTYARDFVGYNIPLEIIKDVIDAGIQDVNHYDMMMSSIYQLIRSRVGNKKSYLIGVGGEKTKSYTDTLRHELTHALYYINGEYRFVVNKIYDEIVGKDTELDKMLYDVLRSEGYPDKTIKDEINAYITTGENSFFKHIDEDCQSSVVESLSLLREKLKEVHDIYFKKHYKKM